MSSESSTERGGPGRQSGFQLWHIYLILSMTGAIWVVIVSRHTHPAALLLVSAAVMAAGLVGMALNSAFAGFFGASGTREAAPLSVRTREAIAQEKALVLRSIKELEFDRAMGKISEEDFAEIGGRLRERAMVLIEDLDRSESRTSEVRSSESAVRGALSEVRDPKFEVRGRRATCSSCGTESEPDARFCRECGAKL